MIWRTEEQVSIYRGYYVLPFVFVNNKFLLFLNFT